MTGISWLSVVFMPRELKLTISSISGIIVSIGILLSYVCVILVSLPYFFVYGNLILLSLAPMDLGGFSELIFEVDELSDSQS